VPPEFLFSRRLGFGGRRHGFGRHHGSFQRSRDADGPDLARLIHRESDALILEPYQWGVNTVLLIDGCSAFSSRSGLPSTSVSNCSFGNGVASVIALGMLRGSVRSQFIHALTVDRSRIMTIRREISSHARPVPLKLTWAPPIFRNGFRISSGVLVTAGVAGSRRQGG
jgi:hypothetical protein